MAVMPRRTIKQIISGMEQSFVPENAEDLEAVLQYKMSGEGGGDFYVVTKDKKATVHEGIHAQPTLTFIALAEDYIKMDSGELSGVKAFFSKKLILEGDTKLASKLPKIFKPREE